MDAESILVVCTANVCRSPLAEMLMRTELKKSLGIRVESAGTHAQEGLSICALVQEYRETKEWAELASVEMPRFLTPALLDGAALILAASRDVRSEIVRLDPAVRDRVYTLREAAHRGSQFRPADNEPARARVTDYAAHLDRARLTMGPVPPSRRIWSRPRKSDDPMSIVDRHGSGSQRHARTLREVASATEAIVEQLNRLRVQ